MKRYLTIFAFITATFLTYHLDAMPAQVILIRHAEKSPTSNELSLKGRERAAALVPYILETPELIIHGSPAAIYATVPPKPDSSQRAIETVKGLAENLKLTVRNKFESNDYKHMVEEIKSDPALVGKTVLICTEHQVIPEIARAFGAFQTPATWLASAYDRTWLITFQQNNKAQFQNLPQRLMYGDSST